MKSRELRSILEDTLHDGRLTRSERRALSEVLEDETAAELAAHRSLAFDLAKARLSRSEDRQVLEWLEEVVKVMLPPQKAKPPSDVTGRAYFSPGLHCLQAIEDAFDSAGRSVDVCVFTITDDRITRQILRAKDRGIGVRIITDNDKAFDRGSDIERLERAGVPVRVDQTEHHMHHKFALFDREILLTGSYNWTRSAASFNAENLVLTDHEELVAPFCRAFDELWNVLDS